MKFIIYSLFFLNLVHNAALAENFRIIKSYKGVFDYEGRPSLCLTHIQTQSGQLAYVVEEIEDCWLARGFALKYNHPLNLTYLKAQKLDNEQMLTYLESEYGSIEYFYLSGE